MRMYLYYAWHSFLGVLRKLFRTWVAILIGVCLLFGVVVGLAAGALSDAVPETAAEAAEEPIEAEAELPHLSPEDSLAVTELAAGAVCLFVLGLNVFTGEKSGSHIFTMADVNLLFPAPRKPQSVLLFKLGTRLFTYLLVTLYLGFQIPNLVNMGLPLPLVLSLFPAWFFLLVFGQLVAVLIYTLTATHEKTRRFVRPAVYAVLGVTAAAFLLYTRSTGQDWWTAARGFFNAPASRFIPVWGWIKALPLLIMEQKWLWVALDGAGLIAVTVLLVRFIWSLDADFYEDALGYAEELDRATREAQESGKGFARLRKKERKTRERDLAIGGAGASVFFRKALFNRFRLAFLRVFTKTGVTNLAVAVVFSAFGAFAVQSHSVYFLALPLLVAVFIRSFGNPIVEDSSKPFFLLIPEKTAKKVFWSHLGGTVNTLLDLVPAVIAGWAILRCDLLQALLWLAVLVTVDFYAASFGVFTDFILPDAIPQQVKAGIQVMLIYFSVLPAGICLILAAVTNKLLFLPVGCCVNLAIGTALTCAAGAILDRGKK